MKCPLLMVAYGPPQVGGALDTRTNCIKDECAWWTVLPRDFVVEGNCSIPIIADTLDSLDYLNRSKE
jgi:hypothetical protein